MWSQERKMRVKVPFQVLFLLFVVLGLYYPGLFAGFSSTDDLKMVTWIENEPFASAWDLFRPGGGFYYRPLLLLTFFVDNQLWGMQPGFMHLENMLLHGTNAVMVFFIARRVFE